MSEHVLKITDENFKKEVLQSGSPFVLDFSANWCGPCKAIPPILEKIAEAYNGKIKVGKLDVDDSQSTAQQYRVFSIPTILVFKDGQVMGQIVGMVPQEKIEELIDKAL